MLHSSCTLVYLIVIRVKVQVSHYTCLGHMTLQSTPLPPLLSGLDKNCGIGKKAVKGVINYLLNTYLGFENKLRFWGGRMSTERRYWEGRLYLNVFVISIDRLMGV